MNAILIITDLTTNQEYKIECPFTEEECIKYFANVFVLQTQIQYTIALGSNVSAKYSHLKTEKK